MTLWSVLAVCWLAFVAMWAISVVKQFHDLKRRVEGGSPWRSAEPLVARPGRNSPHGRGRGMDWVNAKGEIEHMEFPDRG